MAILPVPQKPLSGAVGNMGARCGVGGNATYRDVVQTQAPAIEAGWYPDPWIHGGWRWWDGRMWSPVAGFGNIAPGAGGSGVAERRWFPPIPQLPLIAGIVMYLGLAASVVVDRASVLTSGAAALILGLTSLALSLTVAPGLSILTSLRWGTRRYFRDTGFRFRWSDLWIGPVVAVAAWIATITVGIAVQVLGVPSGTNTDGIKDSVDKGGAAVVVIVVLLACILAPITEELAMRGVVMRALRSRTGVAAAILIQGVLFGALHILPSLGWENIGLVAILSTTGIVFGIGAWMTGRIGTTMIAHAIFNGSQIALLLTHK